MSAWQPGQSFVPFSPGAPKSFAPGTIRFVPKSQWQPDSQAKTCFLCHKVKFGVKNRRHHCRLCGQVCCGDCSGRRHPKYPDTRICTPCYSMIMVGENSLQSAGWYHGALKRPLAETRLLSAGTRYGDFMVRESGSVDGYIALSVRADDKVLHYLIHEKFGKFFIGNEPSPDQLFSSIQNLITESKAKYNLHRAMIVESFKGEACPQCGATVNDEMEFCEECGTRLRSTKEQIQLYEDQGAQDVTYDDDGNGQIYDDDEGGGGAIYDDDEAPQLPMGQPNVEPQAWQAPVQQSWQPQSATQWQAQPQQQAPQQQQWQQTAPQQQAWQQPQQAQASVQQWQQPQQTLTPQNPTQQWQQPQQGQAPAQQWQPQQGRTHKFCHNCGSKEALDAAFCGSCGTNLAT